MCDYGNYSDIQCVPRGEGEVMKCKDEAVSSYLARVHTHIVTLSHTHTHAHNTYTHTHPHTHLLCGPCNLLTPPHHPRDVISRVVPQT